MLREAEGRYVERGRRGGMLREGEGRYIEREVCSEGEGRYVERGEIYREGEREVC